MPVLNLTARLGIDGRGFRAGLKEAEVASNRFARNLKAQLLAVFSVAAMVGFLRGLAETVGRIKDLSEQYSITTDEVQRADVAMKKNGLQFEMLGQSLQKLGSARREAAEEGGELLALFDKYGVTLADLQNPQLRTYDLLLKIASAIRGQNLSAREQIELTDLLGSRAHRLITTLQQLHEFDQIAIIDRSEIDQIDEANKKLEEMKRKLMVIAAYGVTEAARNPKQFIGDYLRSIPPIAPLPAALNLLGQLIEKSSPKPGAPALTELDIANAQIDKSNRNAEARSREKLFDEKVKKHGTSRAFQMSTPGLSGIAAGGGFSAGIAGLDPGLFIQQNQLAALKSIDAKVGRLVPQRSQPDTRLRR